MYTLEEIYSYEEEGRKLAFEYMDRADRIAYGKILRFLGTIDRVFDEMVSTLVRVGRIDEGDGDALSADYLEAVFEAKDAARYCSTRYPPRACDVDKDHIQWYNNMHEKVFGSGCAWGLDSPKYNLTFALNDLTSCYHKVADEFATYISKPIGSKGYATKTATENSIKFCELWDDYAEKMLRDHLYYSDDYRELTCIAKEETSSLRVGSSPGHATIVDFTPIVITYYDDDTPVNLTMMHLLTSLGLRCGLEPYSVDCYGLDKLSGEKMKQLAKYIASATSMDLRISDIVGRIAADYKPEDGKWADAYERHPEIRECFDIDPSKPSESYSKLAEKINITGEVATEIESWLDEVSMLAVAIEACAVKKIYGGET